MEHPKFIITKNGHFRLGMVHLHKDLLKSGVDLTREHDALRRQIRKEHNASIKLQLKKEENQKGKLLSQKRAILFDMEDEYADKVDKMTDKLQLSMKNSTTSSVWFKFRWKLN